MFELDGDQFDLAAIEKFAKDDNKTMQDCFHLAQPNACVCKKW